MKRKLIEEKFLDYIEGLLPAKEAQDFEAALAEDPGLKESFEQYRTIIEAEILTKAEEYELHPAFEVKVMNQIAESDSGFIERLYMKWIDNRRMIAGSLATFATLAIVVKLAWQIPDAEISREGLEFGAKPASVLASEARVTPAAIPSQPPQAVGPVVAREEQDSSSASGAVFAKQSALSPGISSEKKGVRQFSQLSGPIDAESAAIQAPVVVDSLEARRQKDESNPLVTGRVGKAVTSGHLSQPASSASEMALDSGSINGVPSLFENETETMVARDIDGARILPPPSRRIVPDPWYRPRDTENYIHYTENPRISVKDEALSTFSIDVDTGSYANLRRFLMAGKLPPSDAVRTEELINYFSYDYPRQHDKPFTVSYEIAPSPLEQDRHLLKIGIRTRDAREENKPKNLVFLLDVSGSMADANKLDLVKPAMRLLVEKLNPQDRVAIVTYANGASVALESTEVREKSRILDAIDRLHAAGGTNGADGIRLAYEQAQRHNITDGVNRVILTTDGDFNVGTTSFEELIRLIEEKRRSGVTLSAVGVGAGNLKEGMLEQLADKGDGNYFYLDSFKEARKVFESDLAANLEVVAKDVKLQVEFNPQHVAQYRLIGYDNRRLEKRDFNDDRVDAGEIGTAHTVTAIYELLLATSPLARDIDGEYRYQTKQEKSPAPEVKTSSELGFLKIRYKEPQGSSSQLLSFPLEAVNIRRSVREASDDFRFAAAVSGFGHLLRRSQFAGNYTFRDVISLAEGARGKDLNGQRQEFIELAKNAAASR